MPLTDIQAIMNGSLIAGLTGLLLVGGISAQIVVPPMPEKLMVRPIGGSTTGGVEVVPPSDAGGKKVRYTTHIMLADERQWTSTDGKTLLAKWIAFEDVVVETPKGAAPPAAPVPPANPTLIRDGKIRLLAKQKPFELALDRLSQADRDFVEQRRVAHATKAPPTPP